MTEDDAPLPFNVPWSQVHAWSNPHEGRDLQGEVRPGVPLSDSAAAAGFLSVEGGGTDSVRSKNA